MTDDFEAKIRELHRKVLPLWGAGEVSRQPQPLRDHNLMVIYLIISYDHLHETESSGLVGVISLHTNPIVNIYPGEYTEYGNVGISPEGAKHLLQSLEKNRSKGDLEAYRSDVQQIIEIERRIFELTGKNEVV